MIKVNSSAYEASGLTFSQLVPGQTFYLPNETKGKTIGPIYQVQDEFNRTDEPILRTGFQVSELASGTICTISQDRQVVRVSCSLVVEMFHPEN